MLFEVCANFGFSLVLKLFSFFEEIHCICISENPVRLFFSIVLRQNITIRIPVETQNFYEVKVYFIVNKH